MGEHGLDKGREIPIINAVHKNYNIGGVTK